MMNTHPIYAIRYHNRVWVHETLPDPRHHRPVYRRWTWCTDICDAVTFLTHGWAQEFAVSERLNPGYEIVECAGDEVRF